MTVPVWLLCHPLAFWLRGHQPDTHQLRRAGIRQLTTSTEPPLLWPLWWWWWWWWWWCWQVLSLVAAGVPDCGERSISNILHGLAVLELDEGARAAQLADERGRGHPASAGSRPRGRANSAWALAALHVHPGQRLAQKLLSASAAAMLAVQAGGAGPQLGWAVATLQLRVPEHWLSAWRGSVAKSLQGLNPQGMSMVLWSAARITDCQLPAALSLTYSQQQQQQQPAGAASAMAGRLAAAAAQRRWLAGCRLLLLP